MAKLRSPKGCPWDREQDHLTLRWHAVEEVYELMDAIESNDDHELEEVLPQLGTMVFDCLHPSVCDENVLYSFISDRRQYADRKIDVFADI